MMKNLVDTSILMQSLQQVHRYSKPFEYSVMTDTFSIKTLAELNSLPTPEERNYVEGKRRLSKSQFFFNKEMCEKFLVCKEIVSLFLNENIITKLSDIAGVNLFDSCLRIGLHTDVNGFWLEPHTDISEKLLTITFYINQNELDEDLGTDLFYGDHTWAKRIPFRFNTGFMFTPGKDTWHGFIKRPMTGFRKVLIVNYVTQDWINKTELSNCDS